MKKFEYKVLKLDLQGHWFSMGGEVDAAALQSKLTELGNEGWELVNSFDTSMGQGRSRDLIMVFKKEKQ